MQPSHCRYNLGECNSHTAGTTRSRLLGDAITRKRALGISCLCFGSFCRCVGAALSSQREEAVCRRDFRQSAFPLCGRETRFETASSGSDGLEDGEGARGTFGPDRPSSPVVGLWGIFVRFRTGRLWMRTGN